MADKKDILAQVLSILKDAVETVSELEVAEKREESRELKVIHFKKNPMELAVRMRREEYDRLKRQNEKLKLRLDFLEAGNESDLTKTICEANDKRTRIDLLKRRVQELEQKEEKLLSSYSRMGREFREAFYLLTGLRINALGNDVYEVMSMYAENENDKLLMKIAGDGTTHLLQNEYSDRLTDYIETYLENYDSFPLFLAALTLNLFRSASSVDTTEDLNQSVDMMITQLNNTVREVKR